VTASFRKSDNTANDVISVGKQAPHKIKKGDPVWYRGKVSPAYESHVFWPSPPKSKGNKSAVSQKQLFLASASKALGMIYIAEARKSKQEQWLQRNVITHPVKVLHLDL